MNYDVIVVGGGSAGLTASAFLAKFGIKTLLLEKQPQCGGLVNAFSRGGFTFDGGIRALDNAGALFPMLDQLGIEIDFVPNPISIGIEKQVIHVADDPDLVAYESLLKGLYPQSAEEIAAIVREIKLIMQQMQIQYGIDNPIFLDFKKDRDYFIKEVFPWMFKYLFTVGKLAAKNRPVAEFLMDYTKNQALVDIIAQHFFTETPAYFALSYFNLYQDYVYPAGGTGVFIQKLVNFIQQNRGEIKTRTTVTSIDLEKKRVSTQAQENFGYRCLLWAADQKTLYESIETADLGNQKTRAAINEKKAFLADKTGNDSIFTLFISSNLDKRNFYKVATGHFFYTPSREGQSKAGTLPLSGTWDSIRVWLEKYLALTTYEISIPALRDSSLAPEGKTGLIISVLFDYHLTKYLYDQGWYEEFRDLTAETMIRMLDGAIYPGLAGSVIDSFTSTPLTIQNMVGSTDGAITGWAFTNQPVPAESRLVKIANSVNTPLPDVFQAGQWTYSPSGLPISLITGKLAVDKIRKRIKS